MEKQILDELVGGGRLVATAIHDGHATRDEVVRLFAIEDASRLRQEPDRL